ncbi:13485_t:CDS:1 [Funneliformis geosporum]|uniref:5499_t:CDS:1 n=1 Tax=Funneliformis geosporum TaxID=1117311 RepID=A0A9W4WYW5_9GLOM|nr:13485_t:CDS:1 [Funneliformis geosporum]CAI2189520.1 5499_t:CDS:1 [Funneliformis geosporum]
MSALTTKPNIVIIGGGYAGLTAAQKLSSTLSNTHQILLIERKSHFHHDIGGLRAIVEEGFEKKIIIPYDHIFEKHGDGKVIHGTVTRFNKNDLIVRKSNGQEININFEIAVIATGSDYLRPAKFIGENKDDDVKEILEQREALKNAQRVLIVGGGPVGIELAGEIASVYGNEKEITLLHGNEELLSPKFPKKLKDSLAKQLKDLNVNLILGERIDFKRYNVGNGLSQLAITTEKGQIIESDIQFVAIGTKPNISIIEHLNARLIDENTHLVKVKPTLQLDLDEYEHIFAIGDITNIPESKLAFRAGHHAELVGRNIVSYLSRKKLEEYKPAKEAIVITVGKNGGAGLLPLFNGIVVGSMISRNVKSKSLFVDKYWKMANATPEN